MTIVHFYSERNMYMNNIKRMTAMISSVAMLSAMAMLPASAASVNTTYLRGDVNLDGVIDAADLAALQANLNWTTLLSDTQLLTADVNADGHVNAADAAMLAAGEVSGEVTVTADENGQPVFCLGGQDALRIQSDSWNAAVANANGSAMQMSRYGISLNNENGNLSVTPWNSGITYKSAAASTSMNANDWNASTSTVFENGKHLDASLSRWGNISIRHDEMAAETAPFMAKTVQYFAYANQNDAMFSQTGFGIDQTVSLVNAAVTKRADGIEFVNAVSNHTVNSFMADDYVTIDGVTLSYKDGEFTVDGIPEDEIEMLHTMTIDQYDEIAVVTNTPGNRFIYGLMYDKNAASMAALVKVRLDENAEAVVIQYSKPADMATTINFYPKEGVLERAFANPDEMVTLFDTQYDPQHLVFQTVHFPRMTKNTLAGTLNARYQITNGYTYKQTAGNASIKTTLGTAAATLSFKNGVPGYTLETTESGTALSMGFDADGSVYKFGNETLTVAGADRFAPDAAIRYASGDVTADFTALDVLMQHIPFRY